MLPIKEDDHHIPLDISISSEDQEDSSWIDCSEELAVNCFSQFNEVRKSGHLTDVIIKVEGRELPAHRVILSSTIPFVAAMFGSEMAETNSNIITLPNIDADTMESILNFAYSGQLKFTFKNIERLLKAADYFQLTTLSNRCAEIWKTRISEKNVFSIRRFAIMYNIPQAVVDADCYIQRNFCLVSKASEFAQLDFSTVLHILNWDELHVDTEGRIFEAVCHWLEYDASSRHVFAPKLLTAVRMPLLRPSYIIDVVSRNPLIWNSMECRDLIDEAKNYHLIPERRSQFKTIFKTNIRMCTELPGIIYALGGLNQIHPSPVEFYEPATKRWGIGKPMLSHRTSSSEDLSECIIIFNEHLICLNEQIKNTINGHLCSAINAIIGHVSFERVASHGPKKGLVDEKSPLITPYFLQPKKYLSTNKSWEEDELLAFNSKTSPYIMAFNGWVMDCSNPLNNFAEFPSQTYLRRELICWGDSVKLKYGEKIEDCPFLWNYMENYTRICAKIFNGLRIDNCHSTPIHVAEHLLKVARNVRKDLYVVAELFTGNEHLDNIFVNRLGITSLIREAQNASNCNEQGRFVYRYGGDPVGAFHPKSIRPAPWSIAHALFCDQTHDNPSPLQKRTVYDFLPTAAMCCSTFCAVGTIRGYDEFFPKYIDVVNERRLYRKMSEIKNKNNLMEEGMFKARKILNDFHYNLWHDGYTQTFVDQISEDITAITRHNPKNNESVLLIANTCFSTFKWTPKEVNKQIFIDGNVDIILFELKTVEKSKEDKNILSTNNNENNNYLIGLTNFTVECYQNLKIENSCAIELININGKQLINFKLFTSGSVIALKINPTETTKNGCLLIKNIIKNNTFGEELINLLNSLTLYDFNYLLFRCESEEFATFSSGAYEIENFGKLPFCGFLGIRQLLTIIKQNNDLGHPFCENLRNGNWLIDYSISRLKRFSPALDKFSQLLERAFDPLKYLSHHLRPCYFEMIFTYFYLNIEFVLLNKFFSQSSTLPNIRIVQLLLIASNAFIAFIPNSLLPQLAAKEENQKIASLSAGLPHFSQGIWRNWGRDTFISLPGILLKTGRFEEAKNLILVYAGTLRHGLIPNLLAEGKSKLARFNCRDAVWFWIVAIIKYIQIVPDGIKILNDSVLRLYPTDDSTGEDNFKTEPLHCTIYEALCRHFEGIKFRERNAGIQIDEHMKDEGFNVNAFICPKTGLIYGGNRWNCGTWMDKMGSSFKAGNKGEPATPRDGAAVELQGLAFCVAKNFDKYFKEGVFPYDGLKNVSLGTSISFSEWALKIKKSFSELFYISKTCTDEYVNRKGIIKDSIGSSLVYTDYQLRPNFCVALDISPDLIDPKLAWNSLKIAGNVLALNAPLGICTLDPQDWAYNGYYNNSDDGTNKITAKGWNYHQGPEWLWIACAYLSAKLKIATILYKNGQKNEFKLTKNEVICKLFRYENLLKNGEWASLPELTNAKGDKCEDSCPAQAWSVGYALDLIETLKKCQEEIGKNNN